MTPPPTIIAMSAMPYVLWAIARAMSAIQTTVSAMFTNSIMNPFNVIPLNVNSLFSIILTVLKIDCYVICL